MSLLLLDNYDSFTYNLYHLLEPLVHDITVVRNDEIDLDKVAKFKRIVLSPGPGLPSEAGLMPQLLERYSHSHSILGVCLGMQAIAERFNSPLVNMDVVKHGRTRTINFAEEEPLFEGIQSPMTVGLYHSWAVNHEAINEDLEAIAFSNEGWLMALKHRTYNVMGIQFHPESVMTEHGKKLISNWFKLTT